MKVVYFSHRGKAPGVGVLEEDTVISAPWLGTMSALMESGITPGRTSQRYPLSECKLLAPVRPGKVLCVGRNYAAHIAEMGNAVPEKPLIFAKFGSSVIGDGDAITWKESITSQVDWEGELAIVIGKRAKDITEEDAPKHIFGYTVSNDVSARDLQSSEAQWARAKGMDTFCPLGPYLVLRSDIPDPQVLSIKTTVNDEVMQDGNTKDMIHSVYSLVAYCSQTFTLEPGDVILTGSPAGVGKGMTPPRFLKDGDVVSVSIENIGTLTNPCKVIS
ncbi:MAG TPA: fumarylacetoacetate hydrolase family protein [Phototrophicaceae bacterium]|jgi:2-keto-4-pentenoate hydratase/2-oxohepta-3-ene-1,7-dioic acid hydratase in catechol pathway|nr:fumarylacetoacetate hydrolase family protein [Phototrophicaceae bacterium]